MTDLFLDILNTSLSATWVVLAVVCARLVLKKAPRSLVCGLWSLVGLRLVIGGRLESPVTLMPSAEVIPPESLLDVAPVIDSGVSSIDSLVNPVYTEVFRAVPYASVNPLQIFTAIWANLWVLGMIAMAVWALFSWLRIRRRVREAVAQAENVYICDHIDTPFILGLFRPRIYLPSDLEEAARDHVLAHERAHLARRDHWWKPLGYGLLTVNWFNPAMWLAYVLLCRDIEMACDERVVRDLDVEDKKAYSSALLRCSVSHRQVAACPLAFGEVGVKERVKSVLHYKKPAFWLILVTVLLAAALAVGLLTSPESEKAEIRWGGVLYVQSGDAVDVLPEDIETEATLDSVLQDSTLHPEQNGQAVRLDKEYAGQPMYLAGSELYLEEPGGGSWLTFQRKDGYDYLQDLLDRDPMYNIAYQQGDVSVRENLSNADADVVKHLLSASNGLTMAPLDDWSDDLFILSMPGNANLTFFTGENNEHPSYLVRTEEQGWLFVIRDEDYGGSAWTVNCEGLDSFFARYETDLALAEALYSEAYLGLTVTRVNVHYVTFSEDQLSLRVGFPNIYAEQDGSRVAFGWDFDALSTKDGFGFRCRPSGREDWMEVCYFSEGEIDPSSIHQSLDTTFPNGVTATLRYLDDPNRWEVAQLGSSKGLLTASKDQNNDWSDTEHQLSTSLLVSIALMESGSSLMTEANQLGIHLSALDVTDTGLTLRCVQDGTPWADIWTGSDWWIERLENGTWTLFAPPEHTAWTTIAFTIELEGTRDFHVDWSQFVDGLEPGTYRVCKTFSAIKTPVSHLTPRPETVSQTYYAEFVID